MKNYDLNFVKDIIIGCHNNDYNSICKASELIENFSIGGKIKSITDTEAIYYKSSLYRVFMRAYTNYIINNPNNINDISKDCGFNNLLLNYFQQ